MSTADFWITTVMVLSIVFFGGAAVLALAWGMRQRQFENFEKNATSIFDPDEPIGQMTDAFPGEPMRSTADEVR